MKKFLFLFLLALTQVIPATSQVAVHSLKTELLTNPVGLDVTQPRFGWQLKGDKRNLRQSMYELKVSSGGKLVWSSGKVASEQSQYVAYAGPALTSGGKYDWQVRIADSDGLLSPWSEVASFQMGLLQAADWKAQWIESGFAEDSIRRPVQYFRRGFEIGKGKIKRATAYITSHGMYEASINGKRVGDAYLTPGWTSYNNRLQYQTYDVTNLIVPGANAMGVMVGNGWYRGFLAWENHKNIYGNKLGALVQVVIEYANGKQQLLTSDEQWKSSNGSIRFAEIYHGERVDAREEQKGWSETGFDDSKWASVSIANYGYANLVATYNEPVKKHEVFRPVKIFTTPKGEQVIDFGQNLVGWVQLKARGRAGDSIVLKHAEVLDKAGNFYIENLRAAKATATFILNGKGEEAFESHFTFYGFRYLKVEGVSGALNPDDFTAVALYSDMSPTGSFSSSHPLLNQLQHNIQWGQRGNFLDVPTDCPQRDERLGWTGDAQAFSRTAAFNFGVHNFFMKWLKDLSADQLENGAVPHVIPNVLGNGSVASTGWADVANIIPWNMFVAYGDTQVLRNQYSSMKAWVGYMEKNSKDYLWNTGFHFGDWLFYRPFDDNDGKSAVTDKYLIAQCYWAHSTQLLINAAQVLGKQEDVVHYKTQLDKIKAAYLKEYLTPNGRLVSGTQTAYVLALNFDMLPESLRAQAADRLVENIKSYGNHLSTGFIGTSYLCHVLSRFGKTDVAYKLLLQESYPSWLYPVKMGATTIWERWNGIRTDGSFEPASMNSFNHYAYGAIGDWMYRVMAGLDTYTDAPGYKHIKVAPQPGGGLTEANASLETLYGTASSGWTLKDGVLEMTVNIPSNTYATIEIPAKNKDAVTEGGIALGAGLKLVAEANGKVIVEAGSGNYVFRVAK